jgi:hypothetical protein
LVLKARAESVLEAQAVEHAAPLEQMEKEADRTAEIEARVAKADQEAAVAELAAENDEELKAGSEEHTKERSAAEEECNSKLQALKDEHEELVRAERGRRRSTRSWKMERRCAHSTLRSRKRHVARGVDAGGAIYKTHPFGFCKIAQVGGVGEGGTLIQRLNELSPPSTRDEPRTNARKNS